MGVFCLHGDHVHLIIDDDARMQIRDALELRTFLEKNASIPIPLITSRGKNFSMDLAAKKEFMSLPNVAKIVIVADSNAKRFVTKLVFGEEIARSCFKAPD